MELNDLYNDYLVSVGEFPNIVAPRGSRKVSIPDVDTMNKYLFRHYREYMFAEVNTWLNEGVMASYLNADIDVSSITANECRFGNVTFWRVDRCTMIADIDIQLQLPCYGDLEIMDMYLSLWFDMEDGISCKVYDYGMLDDKPQRDLWMLSPFLIPYLSKTEIDKGVEQIWGDNISEALTDYHYRNPHLLAKEMGLEIKHLRLHKQNGTKSILFFIKDTVLVDAPEKGEPPVPVEIPANTIVINENLIPMDNSALEIYHECIHYEWHYMFYVQQAMYNNDIRQLRTKKVLATDVKVSRNPVRWMEWQARYGSFGLMMPACEFGSLFQEEYQKVSQCFRHAGDRYEYIANKVNRLYSLRKCYIRARMIQLGHIAAQGALNYIEDHYIDAFAVSSLHNFDTDFTFVIDRDTILDMYEEDPKFREVIQTGRFIYADGHLVLNDDRFVRMTSRGPRLTAWANKHVDQCCLRFVKQYEQYNLGEYTFGRLYCDADYLRRTEFYVNDYMVDGKDAFAAIDDYLEEFPRQIPAAVELLRKKAGLTQDELAEAAGIDLILSKSISRFARNLPDCIRTIRHLNALGVGVYFEREGLDTLNPNMELLLNCLAAIAEEESTSIGQNLRWANEKRNEAGKPSRTASYGYRKDENKDWVVVPDEARRVILAFSMANRGESYPAIRAALSALEEEEATGKEWKQSSLYYMLRNEVYCGDILTNKNYTVVDIGERRNTGVRQQFYIEGHHTPLIPKAVFERVNELMDRKLLREGRGLTEDEKQLLAAALPMDVKEAT